MVLEFIEQVWNDRDLNKVTDFWSATWSCTPSATARSSGPRATGARCCGLVRPFPAGQFEVRDVADQPRRALRRPADRRASGSSRGGYNGTADFGPLTDSPVDLLGVSQFLVQDGRIVREVRVYDEIALRAQINARRGDQPSPAPTSTDPRSLARQGPSRMTDVTHDRRPRPGRRGTRRTILRADWVPCKAAFIDCRTPGSDRKDNYAFIGAGVSQNADQFVNLTEPHGFNLGAAGMPNGVTNNLHLHFTAEVFINFGGDFRLRWGVDGKQGEYVSHDGDVISVPTWIFRGFTNEGPDDGILLTVLGHDVTGGIIWGPSVLEEAESYGLYLTADNRLIDTVAGDERADRRAAHQADAAGATSTI